GLRGDHVLGLFRLWWVPQGMTADHGTYVRYRHEAMVGLLTGEAARSGGVAIGEDLGTVDAWMRDYLAARRVLGTSMLWFERRAAAPPPPPPPPPPGRPAPGGPPHAPPPPPLLPPPPPARPAPPRPL